MRRHSMDVLLPSSTTQRASGEREVDVSQLFSDVSKTVNGIRHILGNGAESAATLISSSLDEAHKQNPKPVETMSATNSNHVSGSASPFAGLFGGQSSCFKTCGMEDIQTAALRAGELFSTLQTCTIILTGFACLTLAVLMFYLLTITYKQAGRPSRISPSTSDEARIPGRWTKVRIDDSSRSEFPHSCES